MAQLDITEHLTDAHGGDLSKQIRQTHKGMAHFAGSGPEGRQCQHCEHWGLPHQKKSGEGIFAAKKPRTCTEHVRLKQMQGVKKRVWDKVPAEASACKYFKAAEPKQEAML